MLKYTKVNNEQVVDKIFNLYGISCAELFEGLNCVVESVGSTDGDFSYEPIAFIDAGSDDIEVVIFLRVPFSVLALTYPCADVMNDLEEEILEDWIAELSNQLIGKVKNKLIREGCVVKIGLPASYFDVDFNDLPQSQHEFLMQYYKIDNVQIECGIYIEIFNENLVLSPQPMQEGSLNEGDIELF